MNPLLSMDQLFLNKLTAIVEENLHNEKFGPAEVIPSMGMSRSIQRPVKCMIYEVLYISNPFLKVSGQIRDSCR
jgi:hypothetical protein